MTTKLTLTVDQSVINRAKKYSKNSGRIISELVSTYFYTLTKDSSSNSISPKLKKVVGAVRLPKDFNSDDELRQCYENKHL
jgi:Family of unknown function (DUF6364)